MDNSQCITVKELIGRLRLDSSLVVLFVEGLRDLSFWRKYAPISERKNSVVYCACLIKISDSQKGGDKGKLLKLLEILEEFNVFTNRVKVFVDADNDRLLSIVHPCNVVLTDFRDLESYAYDEHTLSEVVHTGLAKNQVNISDLKKEIEEICFPLASLRLLSERDNYLLPFAHTFENNNRKKYIKKQKKRMFLNIEYLIRTLLQNAGISISKTREIHEKLNETIQQSRHTDIRQMLHGKDWTFFFAYCCNVSLDVIEPLVFLGMNYEALDSNQNIASVKKYLFGQAA